MLIQPARPSILAFALLTAASISSAGEPMPARPRGTIAFASQTPRGFDVYVTTLKSRKTTRLTDHAALDYNAAVSSDGRRVAFVSERDGNMEIYSMNPDGSALARLTRAFALDDHPAWSPDGKQLVFVSTRQPAGKPGQSWTALYIMNADGSEVRRLSPPGVTDLSPAWSPRGDWIACLSPGQGICVMRPDGSGRRAVVKDGGWPTFSSNGESLYFHKRADHWGIWQVRLDGSGLKRISPPNVDVCTPSGSAHAGHLAVAVLRGHGRQIELLDPASGTLSAVTTDATEHWNPALAPDGAAVYYHKASPRMPGPRVERWATPPETDLQVLRLVDGMFPAFSADGKRIAMIDGVFDSGRHSVAIMNADGTGHQRIWTGKTDLFSLAWTHRGDRLAFARGGYFRGANTAIDIAAVAPDGKDLKALVADGSNNGFVSFSPDDKQFVFRSGRSGAKNLYIAQHGQQGQQSGGIRRLTEGKWTDTMADWSPTGEWIVFASNRDGNFHLWLIKPDGTGLRKLFGEAQHNHPHFSPDGQWVVFTSSYAGTSAEAVSLPRTDEPFGELFTIRLDGTHLMRLTHNGSSDGTPAWGPVLPQQPALPAINHPAEKTERRGPRP